MIKKINILGVMLDNYTVRESILRVETYLNNHTLNTVESISAQMLMDSEKDPVLKEVISSLDLSVIGDKGILQAAGISTMQRLRETDENDFFFEFFIRMERNKKGVFLLGETEEKLTKMRNDLLAAFPKLVVSGEYAVENCVGDLEGVINDMNATTPDVIVSLLPSPMQEHFFWDHRDKMNTNIWYGAGGFVTCKKRHGIKTFMRDRIQLARLKNSMSKYREKSDREEA